MKKLYILMAALAVVVLSGCATGSIYSGEFSSSWNEYNGERIWLGPDYWANRLHDWQIKDKRIECLAAQQKLPMRNIHILTARLGARKGDIDLTVNLGSLESGNKVSDEASGGFLVGSGKGLDYRSAALIHSSYGRGGGLYFGIRADGTLFMSDLEKRDEATAYSKQRSTSRKKRKPIIATTIANSTRDVKLQLQITPSGEAYTATLTAINNKTGAKIADKSWDEISSDRLEGSIAIVNNIGFCKPFGRLWFKNLKISGSKVVVDNTRNCGPLLSSMYTLSNGVMKLTAQMMPVAEKDGMTVEFQVEDNNKWETISKASIVKPGYIAKFKVTDWNDRKDVNYRLKYDFTENDGSSKAYYRNGVIRKDPVNKNIISVAGFTGNHNDRWGLENGFYDWSTSIFFPHNDITGNVAKQKIDLLFFSGDQVYEGGSPTFADKTNCMIDYLYKWYLWCWAFRDLSKDIPCITIPDDHDIFQGNIWGQGGRKATTQKAGGYVLPAEFVKMVDATQTSHLPDPYSTTPIEQGITTYYTSMNLGEIGFAILEDRKFKTGPDASEAKNNDTEKLQMLGKKQTQFLNEWVHNWKGQKMKVALSQTVFACLHTKRGKTPTPPSVDYDSNGWPQNRRNETLRILRKGFVFMFAGDQHLATVCHHGIDEHRDAGWSFAVPSIANYFPRYWNPDTEAENQLKGKSALYGDFIDGFGNKITMEAFENPGDAGVEPAFLHNSKPGYGIIRLNKTTRNITLECWPRYADPTDPKTGGQYKDWPLTVAQDDNYGRKTAAWLPVLLISGTSDPVIQIIDQSNNEIVYTIRANGKRFQPKVFSDSKYTIIISNPETDKKVELKDIVPLKNDQDGTLNIKL